MSSFGRGPPQSVPLRIHFKRADPDVKASYVTVKACDTFHVLERPVITDAAARTRPYPGPPLPSKNHIRLVLLQPGRSFYPIVCELVTADLESLPPYEALSYTWGDPLDHQAVYVKFRKSQGQTEVVELENFKVTKNCVSALRRLRLEDKPRTLWIDALAIDQSNIEERNHQVTLMSQIYTKTTCVAIYLGESDADSELAIETIRGLDKRRLRPVGEPYSSLRSEVLVKALEAFFRRPWFTRMWVIQEAVLSGRGTVYCGAQVIQWSAVHRLESQSKDSGVKLPSYPYVVSASQERLVNGTFATSMLGALVQTRHCGATDPRDKVYSLLPLLHSCKGDQLVIAPQYGDPVAKVYTDWAVVLVDELGYEVLYAVQGDKRIPGLPSWVPDWSVPPRREILRPSGPPRHRHFWEGQKQVQAPRKPDIHAILSLPMDPRCLRGACFSVGKIRSLGSAYFAGRGQLPLKEWEGVFARIRFVNLASLLFLMAGYSPSACDVSGESLRLYLEHERKLDAAETTGRGRGDNEAASELSWERRVHRMTVERGGGDNSYVLPFMEIPFDQADGSLPLLYGSRAGFVLKNCHSRRIFLTDQGWIGLAPAEAREGDEVLVCVGADKPFVMRQCGGRERREDLPYGERWEVWKDEEDGNDDVRQFRFVERTCLGEEWREEDNEKRDDDDRKAWEDGKDGKDVRQYQLVGEGCLDPHAWESIERGRHELEVIDIV